MRRGIRCFVAIPGMAAASVLSGATEASLPPLSAAGLSKPPPPPEIFDASGRKLPARLIQVQTVFRHGARLPVEDRGCRDGLATWSPSETDKSAQLQRCGRIRLFEFGSGDALDPAELFSNDSEGKLVGGGIGGRLTPLGLRQAVELGGELRARYVDASAAMCADIGDAFLLPASWERAKRLVATRSTRVERTVYTACGALCGLYPPGAAVGAAVGAAADEAGGASPISELEIGLNGEPPDEFLVLNDAACPRLRELFQQGLRLSAQYLDAEQLDVIATIEGGAGWMVDDARWKLIAYRDWYSTRRAAGKGIPPSVESIAVRLDAATARQMQDIFEGGARFTDAPDATRRESLSLIIGRLWTHILQTMGQPDGTLHLLSGHDWSVSPLLLCVTSHDDPLHAFWPPFCSNIAFELWSTRASDARHPRALAHPASTGDAASHDSGRHVRVLYNGRPIALAGGEPGRDTCTLAEFRALVAPYCVRDFASEGASGGGAALASTTAGFNAEQK